MMIMIIYLIGYFANIKLYLRLSSFRTGSPFWRTGAYVCPNINQMAADD